MADYNFFDLYKINPAPIADNTYVAKKYIELQKANHPDFYTKESETDQEDIMVKSAAINEGYKIFKDKHKTIEYFLSQNKVIEPNEKYQLPPEFLMEMIDINEGVLEDNGHKNTQKKVAEIISGLEQDVAPILRKNTADITAEDMQQLKAFYYKKKYVQRILDKIED